MDSSSAPAWRGRAGNVDSFTVYALTSDRTRDFVERCLDYFLPARMSMADAYEYPQYADAPEAVYVEDAGILDRLEADASASYSLYWSGDDSRTEFRVEQAMAIYTEDGHVMVGLVVPKRFTQAVLAEFQREFGVEWGLVTGDECPPSSASQFQDVCRNAQLPHIQNGDLIA